MVWPRRAGAPDLRAIAEARRGSKDLTPRAFGRQFRGLSGTAKAKAVCDQFPGLTCVSQIEQVPHLVGALLADMQRRDRTGGLEQAVDWADAQDRVGAEVFVGMNP